MVAIRTEIDIAAPAPRVWEVLTAIDRWSEWNPFAVRASGRLAVGELLEVHLVPPGAKPVTIRPTVVKFEPGSELRWLGRLGAPGLFRGEHGFRLVPDGAARCRFEHFETFTGLLARPILWMIGDATRRGFQSMNRALKERAEAA
jgi:hypothetical protein